MGGLRPSFLRTPPAERNTGAATFCRTALASAVRTVFDRVAVELPVSLSPVPSPLSTRRLYRLLLWVHWRGFMAWLHMARRDSPLLIFALAGLMAGYLCLGYLLFHAGLNFLYTFPLFGSLLSKRILFLIFAFFFVMLAFSNLIIGYSTLFRNRETMWFLSLPIPHRNVYRWKFFEALAISSWALIFLSAPMMIAYGRVHDVGPAFYFQVCMDSLPFVVIPALLGSWSMVFLVRVLAWPSVRWGLFLLAVGTVLLIIFAVKPVSEAETVSQHDVLSFDKILRHTRFSLNPFLPSAWLAQSVLAWSEGLVRQGVFFFLLLLSNALMGLLIGFEVVGRCFYGSWVIMLSSRAERFQRRAEAQKSRSWRRSSLEWLVDLARPISGPGAALILKDIRLFWRDPTQWTQFMIFFGLLCIYVLNLRNVTFSFQSPFWETMISYLNLAASALTLSTLTTRFVFPQFSLEGRRIWILGLSPIGLQNVLLQKFWMSFIAALSVTVGLMIASSLMLHLPWPKVVFFVGAITLMSASLSGLAVGLGALFPNFKEDNPSKIVSGFGGTLCLVISFIYVAVFVALVAVPDLRHVIRSNFLIPDRLAYAGALVLSFGILFFPLLSAWKRVKNLEI
jgi:ABC-2 type transport system permease protein